jgi:hypothetical protein
MREGPDVLINALAGERVVFRTHAADTGGELIQFDLVLTKVGGSPPAHVHLQKSERFSVRSGAIKVSAAMGCPAPLRRHPQGVATEVLRLLVPWPELQCGRETPGSWVRVNS